MNNRPIRLLTSGRAGLGAGALITAVVLLIALGAVWTPVAFADGCPDAEVTFARGTGEPPGIGRVGQAFVDSLRQQTGMEIGVYPVNYAASRLQLHGGDGANDAISHIKSMASSCPNTKLVLGGYSQGATVIDIVAGVPLGSISFGSPLPAAYADNVAAVAVFGNPSNRAGGSLSSLSPLFGSKAIDLCNPTDPICHVGPATNSADTSTATYPPTPPRRLVSSCRGSAPGRCHICLDPSRSCPGLSFRCPALPHRLPNRGTVADALSVSP